ncbi:MAG: hypothetical protein QXM43_06635 [Desulfurococcaceae archaeon]
MGTVGAGKSTHMKLLVADLRSKELKVKTTQLRVGNLWAHPLYKAALMGRPIFKNKCLFKLWIILDTIAISFKFLISIWFPFKAGYIVFCRGILSRCSSRLPSYNQD